jgi:hypothetical protein
MKCKNRWCCSGWVRWIDADSLTAATALTATDDAAAEKLVLKQVYRSSLLSYSNHRKHH